MKKILTIGLSLALVLALMVIGTGSALAASNQSGNNVEGVITAIDKTVTPPTVTVTPEEGSAVILKIDAATVITKTGVGTITINDLAINDKVTATYDPSTNIAGKITVLQPEGKRHSFEGAIKSINGNTLIVTTKKGDETFDVNLDTQYKVPGVSNAALSNFSAGNKVNVSTTEVTTNGTTVQIAQRMNLIPAKPEKTIRTGTVTAYTAGASITIQDKKGNSSTFAITADTKISYKKGATAIATGDRVTISASRNPSDSQFTAKSIRDFGVKQTKTAKNNAHQNENGQNNGKNNKNK